MSLLVNGKLIEMFEKNPSGGYRTKGIAIVGDMVRDVPGGSAKRPSSVTQIKRFCLDFGVSLESSDLALPVQFIVPTTLQSTIQFHSHLISILPCVCYRPEELEDEVLIKCVFSR